MGDRKETQERLIEQLKEEIEARKATEKELREALRRANVPWEQAFQFIGLPEGVYPLAEATLYLSTAPKSNSAGAYFKAYKSIEERGMVDVPDHLKDSNRDAAALGHGADYDYPHDHEGHFIGQGYLPDQMLGTYFYTPSDLGYEQEVSERLERWRRAQRQALEFEDFTEVPDLSESEIQALKRHHSRSAS